MTVNRTSRISGFYKLSRKERLRKVSEFSGLRDDDIEAIEEGIPMEEAEGMIENVIGKIDIPLGIAVNFLINGRDYLIPMATEESSVVAAASNGAKMIRVGGGFKTHSSKAVMVGQIQLIAGNPDEAAEKILKNKEEILEIANMQDPTLIKLGGGAEDLKVRIISTDKRFMVIVHLLVNVKDAMGANIVNTMCEATAPYIEDVTGGKIYLKILSNYCVERIAKAEATIPAEVLGKELMEGIIMAYEFARSDPYRAVTHNKGVMNGVTSIAVATGNDTRAVEAGAHSYACRDGIYCPLTRWGRDDEGNLKGVIEMPLALGIVGGATMNPIARASLRILRVKTARELCEVAAAVGLAQNLAALKALAGEGIQKGHMSLHARNIAVMAGAQGRKIDEIAGILVEEGNIRVDRAKQLLKRQDR